jgi:hypothetical protein
LLALQEEEDQCEADRLRLRGIVEAYNAKRDMIISLGANLRLEMLNDPQVRKLHAEIRERERM